MQRNENGFTLVEMLVTIVVGSLVTLAATTVLLLGLRINNRSIDTVIRQNTTRVVITMLENLAAEGEINSIETIEGSWWIRNEESETLAQYSRTNNAIYVGSSGSALLEKVIESSVTLDNGKLLTVSVTTEDGTYKSSIYCRTMSVPDEPDNTEPDEVIGTAKPDEGTTGEKGRLAFLNALSSQYKLKGGSPNPGLILTASGYSTGMYYTQWYLGGNYDNHPGWNYETPWCACYVSWALCYGDNDPENNVKNYIDPDSWNRAVDSNGRGGGIAFASVDNFAYYFQTNPYGHKLQPAKYTEGSSTQCYVPTPGDIIFIDWDGADSEGKYDPAHVGVVITLKNGDVYTIEGNMENRIMIRRYELDDERIMGYGIIDWTE